MAAVGELNEIQNEFDDRVLIVVVKTGESPEHIASFMAHRDPRYIVGAGCTGSGYTVVTELSYYRLVGADGSALWDGTGHSHLRIIRLLLAIGFQESKTLAHAFYQSGGVAGVVPSPPAKAGLDGYHLMQLAMELSERPDAVTVESLYRLYRFYWEHLPGANEDDDAVAAGLCDDSTFALTQISTDSDPGGCRQCAK